MIVQYNYKTERDLCKKKKNLEQKFEKKKLWKKNFEFWKKILDERIFTTKIYNRMNRRIQKIQWKAICDKFLYRQFNILSIINEFVQIAQTVSSIFVVVKAGITLY